MNNTYRNSNHAGEVNGKQETENHVNSEVYNYLFSKDNDKSFYEEFSGLGYSKEIVAKYFSRLKKRFERGEVGNKNQEKLYDLATNPDDFSKANLLESLMKKEFRGLRKIEDILKHESKEETWRGIDRLGLDYFRELQQGYGTTVKNRSKKQIKIINEILERTHPFINLLVSKFFEKGNIYAPRQKRFFEDEEGEEKVIVKGTYFKSDKIYLGDGGELKRDLINEASKSLIENMHTYHSEAGSISGFIGVITNSAILKYIGKIPLINISSNKFNNIRRIISESDSREEGIKELEDLILKDTWFSPWRKRDIDPLSPALIYDSLTGNLLDFNNPEEVSEEEIMENKVDSPYFEVAENELKKISRGFLQNKRFMPGKNEGMKSRNEIALSAYFLNDDETLKSAGERIGVTNDTVRQMRGKFKRMVRIHLNIGPQKEFLEEILELANEVKDSKTKTF